MSLEIEAISVELINHVIQVEQILAIKLLSVACVVYQVNYSLLFYKNMFSKNIEAQICEILRIF